MAKTSSKMKNRRRRTKRLVTSSRKKEKAASVAVTSPDGKDIIEVPRELYESVRETVDVMNSPELMRAIKSAREQIAAGKTVAWEDLKAELGL